MAKTRGTGTNLRRRSTGSRGAPEIVLSEKLENRHVNYFIVSAKAVNRAIDGIIAKLSRVFSKELRTDDKTDDLILSAAQAYSVAMSMSRAEIFVEKTNKAADLENEEQWEKQITVEVHAVIGPSKAQVATDILVANGASIPKAIQRAWIRQQLALIKVEGGKTVPSIPGKAFEQASKIIRDAIGRGALIETVAGELEGLQGINLRRAKTLASDQILTYYSRMTDIRHQSIGVTHYIWRTSRDEAVRHSHRLRNGKRYPYKNPKFPTKDPIDGAPGKPVG